MLAERLGLPRLGGGSGAVLAVLLVDALGTGLSAPFSLLYFHAVVGLSLPVVGLALSVATAAALPVAPITGSLVDHYGARRVVICAQLLQGQGFVAYLFVGSIATLVPAALLAAVGQRVFWSALFTLLADVSAPGERDRWYGLSAAAQSAGFGVGGLLSGLAVAAGDVTGYYLVIAANRSEEHTSELSHANISYAVFCLKKKKKNNHHSILKNTTLHTKHTISLTVII